MSNIDKQALREAANGANSASWGNWESYKPHKGARGYEVKVGSKAVAQHCLKVDSAFIAAANPATVLALLDELEAGEQQIKTLESRNRRLDGIIAAAEKRIAELQELRKTDSADREMLKRLYDECDTGERRGNGSQSGVAMPSWVTVEAARLLLGVK